MEKLEENEAKQGKRTYASRWLSDKPLESESECPMEPWPGRMALDKES